MLTLTETATTVVKSIVSRAPDKADGGLRIINNSEDGTQLGVEVVAAPVPGDQVVDTDGARVFLEPSAATVLDNKVLDAQVADTGAVTFSLTPQPTP